MLSRAKDYSWTDNQETATFASTLPGDMNFFRCELRSSVRRDWHRKRMFVFFFFCGAIRGDATGEDDAFAVRLLSPGTDVFRAREVRGKILVSLVPGFSMHGGEI